MSNSIYYKRITGSNIQGDATTVTEPQGTLVVTNNGDLRLHNGTTAGGNPVGGGGGVGSFGTDKGIGADYASNNPAILFSDDDMIIRTGGTAGHGTIGAMYIASAEELIIGHTDASLTDATSLGAGNFTDYLQIDTNGIEMTTARGTVQFGYNLEAPGVPTHFHINKLNESFDLFFGDDSNYFHLPAGGGSPVIGANNGSSGQKLWTFGQDGTTTFPNSSTFNGVDFVAKENDELNLTILDSSAYIGVKQSSNLTEPAAYMDVYFGKKSRIRTTSLDNQTEYDWYFNPDGSLTLPQSNSGAAVISAGTVGLEFTSNGHALQLGTDGTLIVPGEIKSEANTGPVIINSTDGNTTKTWTFGGDGSITFPDATVQTTAWRGLANAGDQTLGGRLDLNGKKLSDGPYEANSIEMGASLGLSAVRGIGGPTGGIVLQTGAGNTVEHAWQFGYDGSITFPDSTVQTTAYRVMSLSPLIAWGTVVSFDNLSFSFDATTGSPGFNGGYGQGNGSYSTLIWTADLYQQQASPTNLTISSGGPVQYFNYNGPNLITEVALTPGDSFVLRIQDVDTNRVYRATFLASFNTADAGNEGKYGAITVERLV